MDLATRQRKRIAYLAALCLFLSTLEFLIPKPLPFMRIGLANLPLLLALKCFSFKEYALLVSLKILGQGLVNGTLFSYIFLFSLSGSLSSAVIMYVLIVIFKHHVSLVGLSVAGAMVSNIAQLAVGAVLVFGTAVWAMALPFLLVGLLSGALLGILAEQFCRKSQWLEVCLKDAV